MRSLALLPGTALPGAFAAIGMVALGHVGGLELVGLLSLARIAAGLGAIMFGEAPGLAATRSMSEGRHVDRAAYRAAVVRPMLFCVPLAVVGGGILAIWNWQIGAPVIFGAVLTVFEALFTFETCVLRFDGRLARTSAFATTRSLLAWVATVLVGAWTQSFVWTASSYVATTAIVGMVFQFPRLAFLDSNERIDLSNLSRQVVSYGVAGAVLNNGDQYLVDLLLGPKAVGLYALGYVFGGGIVGMITEPFSGVIGPRIMNSWTSGPDGPARSRRLARRAGGMIAGAVTVVVVFLLIAEPLSLFRIISTSPLVPAVAVIVAAATGLAAAVGTMYSTAFYLAGRFDLWARATWIAVPVSFVCIVGLTVPFGIIGTALATLVCSMTTAALQTYYAQRWVYRGPYQAAAPTLDPDK